MSGRAKLLSLASAIVVALVAACETPPPAFPHVTHLEKLDCGGRGKPACLKCGSCHDGVRTPGNNPYPTASACASCHANDAEQKLAKTPPPKREGIRFPHDRHLGQKAILGQCVKCHGGVADDAKPKFPPMSTCMQCHQKDFDAGKCTPCHQQADLSQLKPETFMRHDSEWIRHHGVVATTSQIVCNQCHKQSDCADCHDQKQDMTIESRRPDAIGANFVHRGDFIARHPMEAHAQPSTCLRCHQPTFCNSCHVERGISGAAVGSANPHPPGWVGTNTDSRDFHGRAAKRDLLSCAACHDAGPATNCIICHKVGGTGGNPHPRGWQSSRSPSDSMCRYCHGS
jgi:hypothetical protein